MNEGLNNEEKTQKHTTVEEMEEFKNLNNKIEDILRGFDTIEATPFRGGFTSYDKNFEIHTNHLKKIRDRLQTVSSLLDQVENIILKHPHRKIDGKGDEIKVNC